MEAKPVPLECPICHGEVTGGLREHLSGHEKDELVREIASVIEAQDQDPSTE